MRTPKNSPLFPAVFLLLAGLLLAVLPTEADAAIYEDTVRLHILAASDSAEDQNEKLRIRDLVLEKYGSLLDGTADAEAAAGVLEASLDRIGQDVNRWLEADGAEYRGRVTLTKEDYPTRDYGGFSLPSGEYLSLRILLGDAEGQNWWCVLYPPLCLAASTVDSGYTESEKRLVGNKNYAVKFKLLELADEVIGKISRKS